MTEEPPHLISVLDFRRRRMSVRWNVALSSWTALEETPALVHGIVLIRPALPSVCLYGHAQNLYLQIGVERFLLEAAVPQLRCEPELISGGLRRIFSVQSAQREGLYSERYWALSGPDFFHTLARKSVDPHWRSDSAASWSVGIDSTLLRQSWA